jgi:hypothetical protein
LRLRTQTRADVKTRHPTDVVWYCQVSSKTGHIPKMSLSLLWFWLACFRSAVWPVVNHARFGINVSKRIMLQFLYCIKWHLRNITRRSQFPHGLDDLDTPTYVGYLTGISETLLRTYISCRVSPRNRYNPVPTLSLEHNINLSLCLTPYVGLYSLFTRSNTLGEPCHWGDWSPLRSPQGVNTLQFLE